MLSHNMLVRKMMKADLLVAMKAQQKEVVSTLRSLLGALDNAEAVPVTTPVEYSGSIARDVPRRMLTSEDVQQIFEREIENRKTNIEKYRGLGKESDVVRLQNEVALITHYLDESRQGEKAV